MSALYSLIGVIVQALASALAPILLDRMDRPDRAIEIEATDEQRDEHLDMLARIDRSSGVTL